MYGIYRLLLVPCNTKIRISIRKTRYLFGCLKKTNKNLKLYTLGIWSLWDFVYSKMKLKNEKIVNLDRLTSLKIFYKNNGGILLASFCKPRSNYNTKQFGQFWRMSTGKFLMKSSILYWINPLQNSEKFKIYLRFFKAKDSTNPKYIHVKKTSEKPGTLLSIQAVQLS